MKTRILSAILTLALLLSLAPAAVIPALPASAEAKGPVKDETEHLIYYDNFTDYPFNGEWSRNDGDLDGRNWEYTQTNSSDYYYNSPGAVYSEYYSDIDLMPGDDLVSPYFDIPAEGKTTLDFYASGTKLGTNNVMFSVGYHVEGSSRVIEMRQTGAGDDWKSFHFDLSEIQDGALAGKRICIFIIHKDYRNDNTLVIDDFKVLYENKFPIYSEDFSTNPFKKDGWTFEDIDGDGYNWEYEPGSEERYYHNGKGAVVSASIYGYPLTPENLLVSPVIDIPADGVTKVKFWARGTSSVGQGDVGPYEKFRIEYKIVGDDTVYPFSDSTYITENKWNKYVADVSAEDGGRLKGKRIQIIIRHFDCTDQYKLCVDDFRVTNVGGSLPVYTFDFEADPFKSGWSADDTDGDGYNWEYSARSSFHGEAAGAVHSASYADGRALKPSNRLWSPYFTVPSDGVTTVSFVARGSHNTDFAEHFDVSYSEYGAIPRPALISEEFVATNDMVRYSVTLPDYLDGDRVRICIIHHNCTNQLALYLDDFRVDWDPDPGVVFSCNFESDPFLDGWKSYDGDGDGNEWLYRNDRLTGYNYSDSTPFSHSGTGSVFSASWWDRPLTPDNALDTWWIYIPEEGVTTLSLWACGGHGSDYAEEFRIMYYIEDTNALWAYSDTLVTDNEWREYVFNSSNHMDLSGYSDRIVRVVVNHAGCTDQNRLYVDDFRISNEIIDLSASANAEGSYLKFVSEGDYPWTPKGARVQSGNAGVPNSQSVLTATVTLKEAAKLEFKYVMHARYTDAMCLFYVDDKVIFTKFDQIDVWQTYTYLVSAGTHTLKWVYSKTEYPLGHPEGDYFAIKDVGFPSLKIMKGDFDKDGEITVADALAALRIAAKLAEETYESIMIGDVDGDDRVTVADALAILRVAAKLADQSSLG